jgi:hypothetical protein
VYSLAPHNLGEMLYTKRFGKGRKPNLMTDRHWCFGMGIPR